MKYFRYILLLTGITALAALLLPTAAPAQDLFVQAEYAYQTSGTLRYDGSTGDAKPSTGNPGAVFVPNQSEWHPPRITFGRDGNLYAANVHNFRVDRYDGTTGAWIDTFVPTGAGRLNQPVSLHFGADDNLYVASAAVIGGPSLYNSINRYDKDGKPLPSESNVGAIFVPGLVTNQPDRTIMPFDFAFSLTRNGDGSNSDLYVLDGYRFSFQTGPLRVMRYSGENGSFIDSFNLPDGAAPSLAKPSLVMGPEGNLYFPTDQTGVLRYNLATKVFDTLVPSGSGGISYGSGIAFGPDNRLYLVGAGNDGLWRVNRYDETTGQYIDTFIPPRTGGMIAGFSLAFGPKANESEPPVVPEPGTLALLAVPALGLALRRGRSRGGREGQRA